MFYDKMLYDKFLILQKNSIFDLEEGNYYCNMFTGSNTLCNTSITPFFSRMNLLIRHVRTTEQESTSVLFMSHKLLNLRNSLHYGH